MEFFLSYERSFLCLPFPLLGGIINVLANLIAFANHLSFPSHSPFLLFIFILSIVLLLLPKAIDHIYLDDLGAYQSPPLFTQLTNQPFPFLLPLPRIIIIGFAQSGIGSHLILGNLLTSQSAAPLRLLFTMLNCSSA